MGRAESPATLTASNLTWRLAAKLRPSRKGTLGAIDIELDRRGVERSYGNDALPSAEATAFQKVDARLRYRNARIEHDARGCSVYQGTARNGRVRSEALRSLDGRPICTRR